MLRQFGVVLAVGFVLLTVAPAGSPVQVSYVYSDSMAPAIETNDGFLVVPADSLDVGDVVTYWAPERNSYVTHRIVGRSASGFVTKGDNNPTTDQAAGYSHVERSEVLGEVLTYRGTPVTVPEYGRVVVALRGNAHALLAGLGLLVLGGSVRTARSRRTRSVPRVRDVLSPILAGSVVSAVGIMLAGAAVHQFVFVAVATPSGAPNTLTVGEERTTTIVVNRSASPLTHSVVSAEHMRITDRTRNESSIAITARIPPPESTGRHTARLTIRRYPAVLSAPRLRQLGRIHPVIPAGITTLLVMTPMYLLAALAFDWRTPIRSSRSRWLRRLGEVFR